MKNSKHINMVDGEYECTPTIFDDGDIPIEQIRPELKELSSVGYATLFLHLITVFGLWAFIIIYGVLKL